ncbi:hypothetical protein FHL15_006974 [Xylaria flabelliformis]|uniref:Cytochrome P450 n=1 Tax=Xylaria flabelliformis TaxID=2512241 RepID=A0A553HVZ6_9PEZI|nr:hypothetical protein FHL15_006974 [Xylaria flabelliformis]
MVESALRVLSAAYALSDLETWEYEIADKVESFIRRDRQGRLGLATCPPTLESRLSTTRLGWITLLSTLSPTLVLTSAFLDQKSDLVKVERMMDGALLEVKYSSAVAGTESVFPDPKKFDLDCWLGKKGKELQPYFATLSAGSRNCIGRSISYPEQIVLLASVVHRYGFAFPNTEWEQERCETTNLMPGLVPLKSWKGTGVADGTSVNEKKALAGMCRGA